MHVYSYFCWEKNKKISTNPNPLTTPTKIKVRKSINEIRAGCVKTKMYLVFEIKNFSAARDKKFVNSSKQVSVNCGAAAIIFLVAS